MAPEAICAHGRRPCGTPVTGARGRVYQRSPTVYPSGNGSVGSTT